MARKKKTKETVNETVIKNADEMFEDIKKLASEDENVVNTIVKEASEETNSIEESNIETDTIEGNTKTEDNNEEVSEEVREKIKEFIDEDTTETMTPEEVFDKLSKDFGNNSDIDKDEDDIELFCEPLEIGSNGGVETVKYWATRGDGRITSGLIFAIIEEGSTLDYNVNFVKEGKTEDYKFIEIDVSENKEEVEKILNVRLEYVGDYANPKRYAAKDFVIKQEKVQAETNSETTDNAVENKNETTEETKKEKSKKKHRMTYEEMFGYTWMGYGYNE